MTTIDQNLEFASASVADIALNFPQATSILDRYNLDYCCNGKKSFTEACSNAHLNADAIWQEIVQSKDRAGSETHMKFETWDTSLLIDFIIQHHHRYVRESIPVIKGLLDKVCLAHSQEQPELEQIRSDFAALAEELLNHLPKEEEFLFPAIRKLAIEDDLDEPSPLSGHLKAPISMMEHEHESAGALLKSIRSLTQQYTLPAFACPTYQMTYKLLKEFDNDLIQHIHLENNILFPRALFNNQNKQQWN